MAKIHELPQSVVAKIAAGEVIERPGFVVKELIENSIDAGADYIRIDIEKSGLQKITVLDNGEGMNKIDIQLSFERYTTSKIWSEHDLVGIKSLGFRGEALASIAAVSDMLIKSKVHGDTAGTVIELSAGYLQHISPIGMPYGTCIEVNELFYSVPARQKFLNNSQSEFRHIAQIVTHQALAHPKIRFFLTHNKKVITEIPQHDNLADRVKVLLGEDTFEYLIPVKHEVPHVKVTGFISKPQLSTKSANKHYLFVNKRSVKHKIVTNAVKEAYGTLLESDSYPVFILFIETPYETVDVNVHPRKEEVHFLDNDRIAKAVEEAVAKSLAEHNLTFHDKRWKKSEKHLYPNSVEDVSVVRDGATQTYGAGLLKEDVLKKEIKPKVSDNIAQFHDLYLVAETREGIILIDQHAAHERVLYEEFVQAYKKQRQSIEQYDLPNIISFELSFPEAQTLRDNLELFSSLGFDISEFGGNSFKVNSVPMFFKDRHVEEMIREIIDDLMQDKSPKEIDSRSHKMLAYLACRSAIKAGQKLYQEERKDLL